MKIPALVSERCGNILPLEPNLACVIWLEQKARLNILRHARPGEVARADNQRVSFLGFPTVALRVEKTLSVHHVDLRSAVEHFFRNLPTCQSLCSATREEGDNFAALLHMVAEQIIEPHATVVISEAGNNVDAALSLRVRAHPRCFLQAEQSLRLASRRLNGS